MRMSQIAVQECPRPKCQGFGLLQIALGVLAGWGVVIYGSIKIFGGKKKDAPAEAPASSPAAAPAKH